MKSTKPFIEKYLKHLYSKIGLLLLLFFGAVFLFGVIIHEVLWENETKTDFIVFHFITANMTTPELTSIMTVVTFFASSTFLQIAYPVLVLIYLAIKDFKRAIEISIIGVGGYLVNYAMKLFFHRPRPDHPLIEPLHNFSFPSGHAMSGFIFYGLLAYLVWKTNMKRVYKYLVSGLLIFFSLLIGFSRVYLRLHFSSDVAAGFCIGFAWVLLSIVIMERQKKISDAELKA